MNEECNIEQYVADTILKKLKEMPKELSIAYYIPSHIIDTLFNSDDVFGSYVIDFRFITGLQGTGRELWVMKKVPKNQSTYKDLYVIHLDRAECRQYKLSQLIYN